MPKKLTVEDRKQNYLAQTGRKELTPAQQRRIRKNENKARGGK